MGMFTKVFALLVALTFFVTDMKPAEAAATFKPVEVDSEYSDLVNVRSRRRGRSVRRGGARRYRGAGRRAGRRYRRSRGRDFGIGLGIGVGSAIIGGVISDSYYRNRSYGGDVYYTEPRRVYRTRSRRVRRSGSDSHVGWCARRYRSYDIRSDTFQPYSGGRRRCNSPYN